MAEGPHSLLSPQPLTRSIYLTNAAAKLGKIWRSVIASALPLFVVVLANEHAANAVRLGISPAKKTV
jgi:hypothetical protein